MGVPLVYWVSPSGRGSSTLLNLGRGEMKKLYVEVTNSKEKMVKLSDNEEITIALFIKEGEESIHKARFIITADSDGYVGKLENAEGEEIGVITEVEQETILSTISTEELVGAAERIGEREREGMIEDIQSDEMEIKE